MSTSLVNVRPPQGLLQIRPPAARTARSALASAAIEAAGSDSGLYLMFVKHLTETSIDDQLGELFDAYANESVEWAELATQTALENWPED